MRNVLTAFLTGSLLLDVIPDKAARDLAAKDIFHTFVMGVYFFPLLGGWLADRFFGKYNTILWFSLLYCVGQGSLAFFIHDRYGFYGGLFLVALGSGGIKPLVASFVGDQFDQSNKHRAKVVFDIFYWSINFGSFFASLIIPRLREDHPRLAFGIPAILMFLATVLFWLGSRRYVRVPPAPPNPDSFMRIARTALREKGDGGRPGLVVVIAGAVLAVASLGLWFTSLPKAAVLCIALVVLLATFCAGVSLQLERVRSHPAEAVDGVRAVMRVLIVFALITPFWSLFDQKASTWVLQGAQMTQPSWLNASMMQALNPGLVMVLLPLNTFVIYPALRRRGYPLTALGKMTVGMALAACAWVAAGLIQLAIDATASYSVMPVFVNGWGNGPDLVYWFPVDNSSTDVWIFWQIVPYILLTLGEVLVSATGLEFAYSQAPLAMKGVIMSFFNLTVTIGGLWVLLANSSVRSETVTDAIASTGMGVTAFLMFFFAAFAFAAALAFRVYAKRYKPVDHYMATPPVAAQTRGEVPTATARKVEK
ncbi:MAG: MFS transporter [Deltaproteobacteria bacterium]|nr:MFS transporter [Deltaproteobacteria bacterium]